MIFGGVTSGIRALMAGETMKERVANWNNSWASVTVKRAQLLLGHWRQ